MFARLYIEALLVNEELANMVWELWNTGVITNNLAEWAWFELAFSGDDRGKDGSMSRVNFRQGR